MTNERSTTVKQKLLITLALLGLLVIAYQPAFAQAPDDDDDDEEVIIMGGMGQDNDDFDIDEEIIYAGPMGQGMGMGMMGMGMKGDGCGLMGMAAELELTKDQRKQLEDLRFNFRKGMIPMRAQLQVLNLELQKMIRSDASRKDIDGQIDQIGRLRSDIQKQSVAHRMAMKAVLTPEQREKLNDRSCMMGKGKGGPMKDVMIKKFKGRGKGL
jgi:Spy/CpxP family protein refolding chaperone